ncbi:MAG: PHP domain-containing protein, partial [Eubacterium sp.]|nr:PHP domain-containing protein [Eubacterium sp.]
MAIAYQSRFFDSFRELKLDSRLHHMFSEVGIIKVTATRETGTAAIYMVSSRFIKRRDIEKVEKALDEQIFDKSLYRPVIFMRFDTGSDTSFENTFNEYMDILGEEIREHNALDFVTFCNERFTLTDGNTLQITCEDKPVAHKRSTEMGRYIEALMKNRFNRSVRVIFKYIKPKDDKETKDEYEFYQNPKRPIQTEPLPDKTFVESADETDDQHEVRISLSGVSEDEGDRPDEVKAPDSANNKTAALDKRSDKKGKKNKKRKAPEPGLIYGRTVEGDVVPIAELFDGIGKVVINGMVTASELISTRKEGLSILVFAVTDFTDTIKCKIFLHDEEYQEYSLGDFISKGNFIKVRGRIAFDEFDHEIRILDIEGIKESDDFRTVRIDTADVKRVELHAHTQMSDKDATTRVEELVGTAARWGHPAIAITDHGVVQAFADAEHALDKAGDDFKVIYGCEMYLVDDSDDTVVNEKGQSLDSSYVVFDLETTGFSPSRCQIIEIGAVKVVGGEITERFSTFVDPHMPIPHRIKNLTQITDEMVEGAPDIKEVLPEFLRFCEGSILVAHNASFDHGFIRAKASDMGIMTEFSVVDTVGIARVLFPDMGKSTLDAVAKRMKVSLLNHHRAVEDAEATAQIFVKMIGMLKSQGIDELHSLYLRTHHAPEIIRK